MGITGFKRVQDKATLSTRPLGGPENIPGMVFPTPGTVFPMSISVFRTNRMVFGICGTLI